MKSNVEFFDMWSTRPGVGFYSDFRTFNSAFYLRGLGALSSLVLGNSRRATGIAAKAPRS